MDALTFRSHRKTLKAAGGCASVRSSLEDSGFVADGKLTTGVKPFNVFARVASGAMVQPGMESENAALGDYGRDFVIACNRKENDDNWADATPEWIGKASMGPRHRFLSTRDLSWHWFNCLTFGLDGDPKSLRTAIETLETMMDAARAFASATPGWSPEPSRLGMFFHCYPHNSVNSLHMHLVDLNETGPTFEYFAFKNISAQAVVDALKAELVDADRAFMSSPASIAETTDCPKEADVKVSTAASMVETIGCPKGAGARLITTNPSGSDFDQSQWQPYLRMLQLCLGGRCAVAQPSSPRLKRKAM